MAPEPALDEVPSSEFAATAAAMALGSPAVAAHRFTTGSAHFVFEVTCGSGQKVVVRAGPEANRAALIGSARLYRLLHPLGVPLPEMLAENLDHRFPYLVLERLPGTDLGHVIGRLDDAALEDIAARVARAQAIVATTPAAGRYGYAVRAELGAVRDLVADARRQSRPLAPTPHGNRTLGLENVERVAELISRARDELDAFPATPFLHDTTTKNVIVTADGSFSGIVDVDDLCFGDPRYVVALTEASLSASGDSRRYTQHWLRIARFEDDRIFRLYVSLFLVDFMSEYGQVFNGNQKPLSPETHRHLLNVFADSLGNAA